MSGAGTSILTVPACFVKIAVAGPGLLYLQ